jgi:mono/diheme cytochrome c family protein
MTTTMRMTVAMGVVGVVAGVGLHAAGAGAQAASGAKPAASAVARGKYLMTVGGCNDCHTPLKMGPNGPEPDVARLLSGHPAAQAMPAPPPLAGGWMAATNMTAWAGPWGVSYTRNLTPDKETGLGAWTEQQFIETMRNGRQQGRGRQLLPPMPWQNYAEMTDADLKALFAYLKSIPAIVNKVPDPVIAGQ